MKLSGIKKYCVSFFASIGVLAFFGMLLGVFVIADAFLIEPNWIAVERAVIHDAELAKIVQATRIVLISDIHLERGIGFRERQLIRKVNALKPDILFFTGDLVDGRDQIPAAIELFKSFNVKIGIYAVLGNTDHIVMDAKSMAEALRPAGINLLVNETRKLRLRPGYFLWIVGVDDPKYGYDDINRALASIPPDVPKIMLAHAPKEFDLAARYGINLVLAGDTHGGQVGIPFLVRLSEYASRPEYMKGLFTQGKTRMYVNRGIGTKTRPVRFFCRPEITVIEIKG
ncbi:MAG: metallophosphoesterase [Candidatus Omnitrophica bacterium]|nr:metallophosphoesterase [Candidatus Omnitrophota bacterium]